METRKTETLNNNRETPENRALEKKAAADERLERGVVKGSPAKGKRFRRWFGLLALVLLFWNLAGCGQAPQLAATGSSGAQAAATRTIKDMAGRSVTVPGTIKTAFATSPVGSIALYALAPEKMVGWNYELTPTEKKFILPQYHNLPNLGGWQAKNTGNIEEIIKVHPDILIDMGDINPTEISTADKLQAQLGIPVVLVEAPVTEMDKALEFLGELLGEKVKAQELADYCRNTVADVTAKAALIPQEKRLKVYYAEGPKGLATEPDGSAHIETLQVVGGLNAAKVAQAGRGGMSAVSLEQVLAWNPEVILAWSDESKGGAYQGGAYQEILTSPGWKQIKAVQQQRVYGIPDAPFNWFDRPPSINRIIGFKWLGHLLYPDVFNYDMIQEVKTFYIKFYHYPLTDDEAKTLLAQKSVS